MFCSHIEKKKIATFAVQMATVMNHVHGWIKLSKMQTNVFTVFNVLLETQLWHNPVEF